MLSLKQILLKYCQVTCSLIITSSFEGLVSLVNLPITIWDCCGPYGFELIDISIQTLGLIGFLSDNYQLQNGSIQLIAYFFVWTQHYNNTKWYCKWINYHVDSSYQ